MKISNAIIIFLVAIIALVAEFVGYMIFGVGAALTSPGSLGGVAAFFVGLMILTAGAGLFAPLSSFFGYLIGKIVDLQDIQEESSGFKKWFFDDIGTSIFYLLMGLTAIFAISIMSLGSTINDQAAPNENTETPTTPSANTNQDSQSEDTADTGTAAPETTADPTEDYKDNLQVTVEVVEGYGQFDVPNYDEPSLFANGTVINEGDQTVEELEITYYFLDEDGQRVGETSQDIVSMFSENALKSNYERQFSQDLEEEAPSSWSEEIEYEITNIRLK